MLMILAGIAWLAMFILGILVAVKMFQHQMIWQGILTIICAIFGVIYGWQKKDEIGAQALMMPYTIAFIASVILNIILRVQAPDAGI
jgi:hypothetical protein